MQYVVNFTLPEGVTKAIGHISDFEQIVGGMNYDEYCEYVEDYTGNDYHNGYPVINNSIEKIAQYYSVTNGFTVGKSFTCRNTQRKIFSLDNKSGFENAYFIGPDPGMGQNTHVAPWITAAFNGTVQTVTHEGEKYTFDFGDVSVPWFEFRVNRDCEVYIFSYDNPEFCKDWDFEQLNIPLFEVQMIRASNGEKTMVTPFKKVYKKHFKQGDTVELFNANSGSNPSLNYVTIINF